MRKKTKFLLLRSTIILVFAILAGRVWYVQVVKGSYYKAKADTSKIRVEPVSALRGIVYDRSGYQLVWNTPSWRVSIVPHGVPAQAASRIYRRLAKLIHNQPNAAQIARIVKRNGWRPYAAVLIKARISPQTAMIIKQLHGQLPGVRAEPASIRRYQIDPTMSLAHTLGYSGQIGHAQYLSDRHVYKSQRFGPTDQAGRAGIELSLDAYLHGINGSQQVEVDSGERPVRVLHHRASVAGDSVYLTIDRKLQAQVAQDLSAALSKLGVSRGVAIIEDVHSGQILSMVSLPSYNDNWFAGGISTSRFASLLHDPAHPLDDMSTSGQFPPGSTFKIVTAVAALQSGIADAGTTIDDTGSINLCDSCHIFYGWDPSGLGPVTVVGALARSSDIYFYTVAGGNPAVDPNMPHVGAERLATYARLLGFAAPSGIELPGEASGLIPSPQWYESQPVGPIRVRGGHWYIGDTYNMAIGQGYVSATPLQMVNLTATIANGGILYRPRIVQKITGQVVPRRGALKRSQVLQPFVPSIVRRHIISPANLALIQAGMHDSVTWPFPIGTSFNVTDPRIDAAGKTGTAEAPGGPHAWWVGYAPYHNPKIAVAVVVPNANSEGAYAAAPIAHKLFEDYFHLKPAKGNWLDDVSQQLVNSGGGNQ